MSQRPSSEDMGDREHMRSSSSNSSSNTSNSSHISRSITIRMAGTKAVVRVLPSSIP